MTNQDIKVVSSLNKAGDVVYYTSVSCTECRWRIFSEESLSELDVPKRIGGAIAEHQFNHQIGKEIGK